ncbi:MAG: hypothetical protein HDT43_09100 [Ruminococcaceae bacterium]|nr:hypothetical protein [Oscillospiraceae bacterium]
MGKTILILGNGFDLAHSLPTRYIDFMDFCKKVESIWHDDLEKFNAINNFRNTHINSWNTDESIRVAIEEAFKNRHEEQIGNDYIVTSDNTELTEIHDMLEDNIWYNYFKKLLKEKKIRGENWIDFESEIRLIIEDVDRKADSLSDKWADIHKVNGSKLYVFAFCFRDCVQKRNKFDGEQFKNITVKDFRKESYDDLVRLIRALEIYLSVFVEKIELKSKKLEIEALNPDFVINFNYTTTYERNYRNTDIHYIHGKANAKRSTEDSDLVLGIDEYWSPSERDQHTFFTIFKKFSQRIQKHTRNDCYRYLAEIEKLYVQNKTSWSITNFDIFKDHPIGVSSLNNKPCKCQE